MMMMMFVMAVMRQAESATQKLLFFFQSGWVLSSAWVWFLQAGVPLAGNQESVHFTKKTNKDRKHFYTLKGWNSFFFVLKPKVRYPSAAQEAGWLAPLFWWKKVFSWSL